jgi:site-specific recombinase XerD
VSSFKRYIAVIPFTNKAFFLRKEGSILTSKHTWSTLKSLLQSAGYNPSEYHTHSLRIGRATDLAAKGYTDIQIALAGRWSSSAYKKYIKPQIISFL